MSYQSEDILSAKTRYRDLVVRIWPYIARYKGFLSLLLCIVIVHTIIGRVLPNIIGYAVDHVIVPKNLAPLASIALTYLSLEVIRFVLVIIETYYFQVLGQKVIYDLRSDLFTHIQKLPVQFFDKNPVGRLVTRLTNDFAALADLFTAGLVSVFTDTLSLFAIVVAMALISWKLTLIVMAISPLMLWVCFKLSAAARDTLRKIKKRLAMINSFVAENISGMKVIQLYVREIMQTNRFEKLNSDYRDVQLQNLWYLSWLYPLMNGFNAITVGAALYYGGILSENSTLAVGALVAFLTHVQDFLPPLRNILEKYQTFQASLASAERIFSLFDIPEEKFTGQPLPTNAVMGHIEFRNVNFYYNKETGPVLRDLSFEIKPGQSIAIVGATGSGKSTIIGLLQRFYEAAKFTSNSITMGSPSDSPITHGGTGTILLDGQDILSLDKQGLRSRVGVVSQDFFIFRGTIAGNISLNDPRISTDRIRQAALRANCEELLKSHEGGLESIVQERGANLSTGEKQLISFARVLAFNPDILILDEATAHIDSHSEALIQQATREITKGRTSIIIAHRLSTILECDWILVMDDGRLIEQGNHTDLLAHDGIYRKLYNLQLAKQSSH